MELLDLTLHNVYGPKFFNAADKFTSVNHTVAIRAKYAEIALGVEFHFVSNQLAKGNEVVCFDEVRAYRTIGLSKVESTGFT